MKTDSKKTILPIFAKTLTNALSKINAVKMENAKIQKAVLIVFAKMDFQIRTKSRFVLTLMNAKMASKLKFAKTANVKTKLDRLNAFAMKDSLTTQLATVLTWTSARHLITIARRAGSVPILWAPSLAPVRITSSATASSASLTTILTMSSLKMA